LTANNKDSKSGNVNRNTDKTKMEHTLSALQTGATGRKPINRHK
jgi:hypothetical protein